ncbi:DNA polymerase IV [Peptoniphilus sp. KCTC 25270]|uniref:DNA polymerase IV n=1 Tax=Peptoniphilus sp. KCTC 25270 TaxID=2897414 RepID=UPI001E63CD70|nr:DNA polymerase IV [Peptoniphilus sp. KCTC 25270]MCD1147808.1 DNA polymerase IV [Peptoniphilus sp. KCTC 25270]
MRKILHVDLDAFYASVEELDNPKLKNYPIAVSGLSDSGIITTANYKAREYGIHSAMPVFMAKKLCPHLVLVPIRKKRYAEMSRKVFSIMEDYTDVMEQVSIDEAYLDLSHRDDPVRVAYEIRQRVKEEIGLTISCGLSYNKFLAKLATDFNKPDGYTRIRPSQVREILDSLPIRKIHGIGAKSEQKLKRIGIETGRDLYELDLEFLEEKMGKAGVLLYNQIRGIDKRPVESHRVRKSIGSEETFKNPTQKKEELYEKLKKYAKEIEESMNAKGFYGHTVTVKIKTVHFEVHTRSRTFERPITKKEDLEKIGRILLDEMEFKEKLRLMGLTLSNLVPAKMEQLYFL